MDVLRRNWDVVLAVAFLAMGVGTYAMAQWWPIEMVMLLQWGALAIGSIVRAIVRAWAENPLEEGAGM